MACSPTLCGSSTAGRVRARVVVDLGSLPRGAREQHHTVAPLARGLRLVRRADLPPVQGLADVVDALARGIRLAALDRRGLRAPGVKAVIPAVALLHVRADHGLVVEVLPRAHSEIPSIGNRQHECDVAAHGDRALGHKLNVRERSHTGSARAQLEFSVPQSANLDRGCGEHLWTVDHQAVAAQNRDVESVRCTRFMGSGHVVHNKSYGGIARNILTARGDAQHMRRAVPRARSHKCGRTIRRNRLGKLDGRRSCHIPPHWRQLKPNLRARWHAALRYEVKACKIFMAWRPGAIVAPLQIALQSACNDWVSGE